MTGVIAGIRLVLWAQFRSFINGLTKGSMSARLRTGGLLVLRLFAFAFIFVTMRFAFSAMSTLSGRERDLSDIIFTSLIHVLGAVLLLGAIKYAYQVFFLSDDIEWLLSTPIPPTRIFTAKFIENWSYSGQVVFSIGWPLCLAYGLYAEAPAGYYVVSLLGTAILAVYSSSLGVIICMPLMRYVKAKRLRELLLTLSMGLSVGLYIIMRQMGAAFEGATSGHSPIWLPTTQLAEVIRAAALGKWDAATLPGVAYIVPALALAAGAHILAQSLYLSGLQRKGEAEERVMKGRGEGILYRLASVLPPDMRAVVVKDALETIRSPRQWFYLVFAIIFLGFQVLDPSKGDNPMSYLFFLVFIASIFSQELTVLGVAREAEMFPVVAASGIPAWRLYMAKWVVGFIPTLVFGIAGAIIIGRFQGEAAWELIPDVGIVVVGIVALISYSVMIGCLSPNFKAYRSRRRVSPWVLILNMFFTAMLVGLILLPLGLLRQGGAEKLPGWISAMLLAFPIIVAAVLFAVAFAIGSARLKMLLRDVPEGAG